ncbi:maleylpyruvate isomerase family mycothiol-dependent enzyme [Cellulomonas endophytica]|uniref:maleylpyruvate isomerase family mycothiol-dependent enzyme n=1 Tax=Cellulomonas endophytica TaxID=2494735 RepID=UPI0013E9361B|nr:maleylpyruvate isomerase family mycothiol-dependent enzyme [Cellulomonas endophytica]
MIPPAPPPARLEAARYLAALRADAARLRALALRADPASPVPACPGWTVDDLLRHVADVHLRQAAAIAEGQRVPPGDPAGAAAPEESTVAHLDRAAARILAAVDRPASTPCWTWPEPRGRLAFWQRRMAQETLIHRVDLEQATGEPSDLADDLALDGVDEVLTVFLPLSLPSDGPGLGIGPDLRASVLVGSGAVAWGVEVTGATARVAAGAPAGAAQVRGDPAALLLWLWGRGGEEGLDVQGDRGQVAALRRALVAATQ